MQNFWLSWLWLITGNDSCCVCTCTCTSSHVPARLDIDTPCCSLNIQRQLTIPCLPSAVLSFQPAKGKASVSQGTRQQSLTERADDSQSVPAKGASGYSANYSAIIHRREQDVDLWHGGVQGRSESSEWQVKWQQAVKELADVKERAWSLLEEKDLQLQSLKVSLQSLLCSSLLLS